MRTRAQELIQAPVPESETMLTGIHKQAFDTSEALMAEVARSVYMDDEQMLAMVGALATGGHALFDSKWGTGKTATATAMSRAVGGESRRVQGSPDILVPDITGSEVYNQKTGEFEFRSGPAFSNMLLIDEIHRMPGKSQAGLLEVMENKQVTVNGATYELPKPFMVLATRNAGVELDGAVRDRFMVGIKTPKQTAEDRKAIVAKKRLGHVPSAVVSPEQVVEMQNVVLGEIEPSGKMEDRANAIIDDVFESKYLNLDESAEGGSRAFLNILNLAQYAALARGSRLVKPDDIGFAAKYVLPHRVVVDFDALEQGVTSQNLVDSAITRQTRG